MTFDEMLDKAVRHLHQAEVLAVEGYSGANAEATIGVGYALIALVRVLDETTTPNVTGKSGRAVRMNLSGLGHVLRELALWKSDRGKDV